MYCCILFTLFYILSTFDFILCAVPNTVQGFYFHFGILRFAVCSLLAASCILHTAQCRSNGIYSCFIFDPRNNANRLSTVHCSSISFNVCTNSCKFVKITFSLISHLFCMVICCYRSIKSDYHYYEYLYKLWLWNKVELKIDSYHRSFSLTKKWIFTLTVQLSIHVIVWIKCLNHFLTCSSKQFRISLIWLTWVVYTSRQYISKGNTQNVRRKKEHKIQPVTVLLVPLHKIEHFNLISKWAQHTKCIIKLNIMNINRWCGDWYLVLLRWYNFQLKIVRYDNA